MQRINAWSKGECRASLEPGKHRATFRLECEKSIKEQYKNRKRAFTNTTPLNAAFITFALNLGPFDGSHWSQTSCRGDVFSISFQANASEFWLQRNMIHSWFKPNTGSELNMLCFGLYTAFFWHACCQNFSKWLILVPEWRNRKAFTLSLGTCKF